MYIVFFNFCFGVCELQQITFRLGAGQGAKGKKNYEHFVGTPNFMSPEQIRNRGSTKESDIFCLGGVFFQIVTGHPPFMG